VTPLRVEERAAAAWLGQAGLSLQPLEAAAFLAAARVLLPPALHLEEAVRAGAAPTAEQQEALRALWLRTGAPPEAPEPMPLHPLAPGVVGTFLRRVREALWREPRPEVE
jgi:hypothetical protein